MNDQTQKRLGLRQALLDTGDPVLTRFAAEWHPDDETDSDYGRGYAKAMACVAFLLAETAGVDTAPYRKTL